MLEILPSDEAERICYKQTITIFIRIVFLSFVVLSGFIISNKFDAKNSQMENLEATQIDNHTPKGIFRCQNKVQSLSPCYRYLCVIVGHKPLGPSASYKRKLKLAITTQRGNRRAQSPAFNGYILKDHKTIHFPQI